MSENYAVHVLSKDLLKIERYYNALKDAMIKPLPPENQELLDKKYKELEKEIKDLKSGIEKLEGK